VAGGEWRVASGGWRVASGGWRVAGGEWRVAGGEWRVASGEWRVASGGWRVASGGWRDPVKAANRERFSQVNIMAYKTDQQGRRRSWFESVRDEFFWGRRVVCVKMRHFESGLSGMIGVSPSDPTRPWVTGSPKIGQFTT
jgi:hypothetical protein